MSRQSEKRHDVIIVLQSLCFVEGWTEMFGTGAKSLDVTFAIGQ